MKILMTGADGYIGSHLKPYIEEQGHDVDAYEGDLLDFKVDMFQYDKVLHLAAMTNVRRSLEIPEEYWRVNVEGSQRVFDECFAARIQVIYFSSSNAKEWWTNPYAATKKAMEHVAPYDSICIRPTTVWPGRPDMLYQKLINKEVEYINGNHERDWIHIDDVIKIVYAIIRDDYLFQGQIVDLGTGETTRVIEVASKMGFEGVVKYDETPHERQSNKADNSLIRKVFDGNFKKILDCC